MLYKPIYIIGYPHGGCTIVCNMLRGSSKVFHILGTKANSFSSTIFGNGLEGHNALYHRIPPTLRNPDGKGDPCWKYAWDENIAQHHLTEKDVTPEDKEQYVSVLEKIKEEWDADDTMRYLDKSQPYLTKTRYVQEMLSPAEVYFIYVIRNPYILCNKPNKFSWYHNPAKAVEQVANNYNCFIEDFKHLKHSKIVKFEDAILKTRETLEGLCKFLELDFEEDMIPHSNSHTDLPHQAKFYPLKTEVVDHYDGIKDFSAGGYDKLVEEKCSAIIKRFNYKIPDL